MYKIISFCTLTIITIVLYTNVVWATILIPPPALEDTDMFFWSIDELVEWIETVDAEYTHRGRYRECLLAIRQRGELFIPVFDDPDFTFHSARALFPPVHNRDEGSGWGNMIVMFELRSHSLRSHLTITLKHARPEYIEIYERYGITSSFLRDPRFQDLDFVVGSMPITTISSIHNLRCRTIIPNLTFWTLPFTIYADGDFFREDRHIPPSLRTVFFYEGVRFHAFTQHDAEVNFLNNITWKSIPITHRLPLPPVEPPPPPRPLQQQVLRFTIGTPMYTINRTPYHGVAAPFMDTAHNRVMIPLRTIADAFEMEANWLAQYRTAQVLRRIPGGGIHDLDFFHEVRYGYPLPDGMGMPIIHNGRVFLPLRYIADLLGAEARWDSASRSAYIYMP